MEKTVPELSSRIDAFLRSAHGATSCREAAERARGAVERYEALAKAVLDGAYETASAADCLRALYEEAECLEPLYGYDKAFWLAEGRTGCLRLWERYGDAERELKAGAAYKELALRALDAADPHQAPFIKAMLASLACSALGDRETYALEREFPALVNEVHALAERDEGEPPCLDADATVSCLRAARYRRACASSQLPAKAAGLLAARAGYAATRAADSYADLRFSLGGKGDPRQIGRASCRERV